MKIVIHGTKGGYMIITPERVSGLFDARPDYNKVAAIGQQAYSIHFSNDSVVFSKYKIIRDVIGDKRTGNIAFSVIIPNNQKLSGKDAQSLLDNLADYYCKQYIVNDNLDNVREDWSFVENIASTFTIKNVSADYTENIQQGRADAAFVYYSSDEQLQKYFDTPYLEEYNTYKQVFFVESNLQSKSENPLNALRHNPKADLTRKIDLDNLNYTLLYNENASKSIKIEVWVNGSKCSNKSKIRRKNELEIVYSKPYYQEKRQTCKIYENSSEYISVDNDAETVTVNEEVELNPLTKIISFKVKDSKINLISDAEITCKRIYSNEEKKIINNEIKFVAEELRDRWTVSAIKNGLSCKKDFFPENENVSIVLILEEPKTLQTEVNDKDNNASIHSTKYSINYEDEREKKSWFRKNKNNPKIFAGILVIIVIVVLYLMIFRGEENREEYQQPNIAEHITQYVEGIKLNHDTLKSYQTKYCSNTSIQAIKDKKPWWQNIFPFGKKSKSQPTDTTKPDYCTKIENAITIRSAINLGKIDVLRSKTYSGQQNIFKQIIYSIDDKYKKQISDILNAREVSKMNLNEVAGLIKQVQDSLMQNETEKEKLKNEQKNQQQPVQQKRNQQQKRQDLQQERNTQQLNSLETEFWNLVHGPGTPQMEDYNKNLLKKYYNDGKYTINQPTQEEKDIISFLNEICKDSKAFAKFKNIPEIDRIEAKTLPELRNKKEK